LEKGARAYFIKPIDLNEAVNTAKKMLEHCKITQG
jgi:DNA-binding response OmpR family regulator